MARKSGEPKSAPKIGVKKKEKDGPKRPMSAFFQFLGDRRPKLISERPELKSKVKDVGKILGDEWRSMTDAEKAPYVKKQEEDKKRYEAEKAKKTAA